MLRSSRKRALGTPNYHRKGYSKRYAPWHWVMVILLLVPFVLWAIPSDYISQLFPESNRMETRLLVFAALFPAMAFCAQWRMRRHHLLESILLILPLMAALFVYLWALLPPYPGREHELVERFVLLIPASTIATMLLAESAKVFSRLRCVAPTCFTLLASDLALGLAGVSAPPFGLYYSLFAANAPVAFPWHLWLPAAACGVMLFRQWRVAMRRLALLQALDLPNPPASLAGEGVAK